MKWNSPMVICSSLMVLVNIFALTVMWKPNIVFGLPMHNWALMTVAACAIILASIHARWIDYLEEDAKNNARESEPNEAA